ncbi:alpha-xylosidase [Massilimaliae timonensis]|uniref:alpha-D-xyloside xylohydrolase n=1 Tax=Massiliimalia timonensis TaxID=1987501 RepID=A0A8J6PDL1_9FIRM|nr:alpha-xylosidase [Massiliimalia timonensis]MBC8610531.1 alpha-xylosidase [Massiliimalia timonensis]
MKFLNGMWCVKDGVTILKAKQTYEVFATENGVQITVPTTVIRDRGQTLNLPVLTVELFSPRNNVIGVRASHFKGVVNHGPDHELFCEKADTSVTETETEVVFRSGDTTAHIKKGDQFSISYYYKDRLLTSTGDNLTGMAYIKDADKNIYMREMLNLSVGEAVYGLGERFTPFAKNGQTVEMWAEDGGTCTEIAYKNVPFYMTNRGYGVFVNYTGKVSYEIASEVVSKIQFTVPEEQLEYHVIGGETLHEVMENYTALTGKPALPPAWSFGLWLTTSFTTSYDEDTVNQFVDGMAERDIPLHVFHYDCFWMREFRWCDFTFDERMFPDPKAMLARMKEKGLKICVWINPYIGQLSTMFQEGMDHGYLLKKANGDVWQWDMWQAGMGLVDFTNPAAVKWYQDKLQELIDMGVDCFKTDFGERIPTDVVYYDGSDPERMHNYYTHLYNKAVFEVLEKNFGKGGAALFARSGIAGGQQFPVHWGGDCSGTYESMAETLRGGLSLSMSGYSFWSHDISGFESTATPDLYKRWCAFGLLSTHSRLHGSSSYRVPWNFDDEASDVLRFFTKLKCSLMPYLFAVSCQAHQTGIPVMRSMVMDHQNDRACDYLDCQYKMGDNIVVAPVFNDRGEVDFYLPQGSWKSLIDEEELEGGRWYHRVYDYFGLGLFVNVNSILPVGKVDDRPDYEYLDGITYQLDPTEDGVKMSAQVYRVDGTLGETVTAVREGNRITVSVENAAYPWQAKAFGQTVTADKGIKEVVITL